MKRLYKFYWDCGRQGDVEGLFFADEETVNKSIGSQVYFGEILGKHSEVYGTLEEDALDSILNMYLKLEILNDKNPPQQKPTKASKPPVKISNIGEIK